MPVLDSFVMCGDDVMVYSRKTGLLVGRGTVITKFRGDMTVRLDGGDGTIVVRDGIDPDHAIARVMA